MAASSSGRPRVTLDGGNYASVWLSEAPNAGRLEWQSPRSSSRVLRLQPREAAFKAYPATAEAADPSISASKGLHAADIYAQARFFDKRYFDFHVTSEAYLEGIASDMQASRADLANHGSLLSTSIATGQPSGTTTFRCLIAIRTGTHGRTLTAVPARVSTAKKSAVIPGQPEFQLDTNQAIDIALPTAVLKVSAIIHGQEYWLALRTAASISFLEVGMSKGGAIRHTVSPYTFDATDMLDSAPADFCLTPFPAANGQYGLAVAVDRSGGIWRTPTVASMRKARLADPTARLVLDQMRSGDTSGERSGFARICYGLTEHQVVVALEDAVRIFDLRDPENDQTLFLATHHSGQILDMAKPPASAPELALRVLVTQKQIIWLDLATPGIAALRYQHHLVSNLGLRVSMFTSLGVAYTILWSLSSSICILLATSSSSPVRMLAEPFEIGLPAPNFQRVGLDVLHVPSEATSRRRGRVQRIVLSETGSDGSLYHRETVCEALGDSGAPVAFGKVWSVALSQLKQRGVTVRTNDLEARKHAVADWRKIYADIFNPTPSLHSDYVVPVPLEMNEVPAVESRFHLPLELTGTSLQEGKNLPLQHVAKSAFTSGLALDAGTVQIQQLDQEYDNLPLQSDIAFEYRAKENIPGLAADATAADLVETLQSTYTSNVPIDAGGEAVPDKALTYACTQVATDLALSRDVLGLDRPIEPDPDEVDEPMLNYEKQSELPAIEFGFFNPVSRVHGASIQTSAARAVLSEWKLGANPSLRPPFDNPYNEAKMQERAANKQFEAYRNRIVGGMDISASQPMPSTRVEAKPKPKARIHSIQEEERIPLPQSQFTSNTQAQSQTQTQVQAPMPFSQVVPGAHGGRPTKRKRLGGF